MIHPATQYLLDILKGEIKDYLESEDKAAAVRNLFILPNQFGYNKDTNTVIDYEAPSDDAEAEETDDVYLYNVHVLERSARYNPERAGKMSLSAVAIENISGFPAFYMVAFITPNGEGNVKVYPRTERGTDYRNMIWWDTRADKKAAEAKEEAKEE